MSDLDRLRAVFIEELTEKGDEIAQRLEQLRSCDATARGELAQAALGLAHTLKGAAAMVGEQSAAGIAHAMESALGGILQTSSPIPDALLTALSNCLLAMRRVAQGEATLDAVEQAKQDLAQAEETFSQHLSAPNADATAGDASEVVGAVKRHLAREANASVRIETARLDRLMALAGELLTTHTQLQAREERLDRLALELQQACTALPEESRGPTAELVSSLTALSRDSRKGVLGFGHLMGEMGAAMKKVRMTPLLAAAAGWRATIADSARELNKRVHLTVSVGDVEVDKCVLESLRDPLIHLLRNSVAHGIESSEERTAKGKPLIGEVRVEATVRGTMVRLTVSDDGKGLDPKRIRETAARKGLLQGDALTRTLPEELMRLIFLPGFSTTESIDSISGRGIGLDVVRREVEKIGGTVDVSGTSKLGGACFKLTLPASLVSTRGLLVRTEKAVYGLPVDYVSSTLRVDPEELVQIDGARAFRQPDGRLLRVRRLGALLGEPIAPTAGKVTVLVFERDGRQMGAIVKEVVRQEEYVTQRLPWNLMSVPGINGAIILADGSVVLTLDVPYLFRASTFAASRESDSRTVATRVRLLLVEDSATQRQREQEILVGGGYDVLIAEDGAEALRLLAEERIDIVVTDIQMPRVDGIELTRHIRTESKTKSLPVLLVTSMGSAEDVAKGAAAGANEYLVKETLRPEGLLEAVARWAPGLA